jgi:hypothetical protein
MWQQWINAILGLWIIAVPFLGLTGAAFTWTLVVTGVVVAVLAVWGAGGYSSQESTRLQHQH